MSKRSETQQRILDAAIKIFAAQGYHGATTAEIAKAASVAEGTIFKYYKTKKQLLRAVLEFIIHELVPSLIQQEFKEEIMKLSGADAKEAIKGIMLQKAEQISQNISCIKIAINEIQYHEDLKQEYLGQLVPGFVRFMEGVYANGVSKGLFRNINPHTAVRSFIGMFAMTILEKNVLNKELDMVQELNTMLDLYLNGVLASDEVRAM